ncbi:MAG TPA: glycosyltransferase family 39 protein [Pirellulales bacterium]|nr:glycosyltransferase family 39 protein [Pirellulales bacterium]
MTGHGRPESAPSAWLTARRERLAVGLLLLTTFALAAGSAAQKSVTVDEYQALPHGLAILTSGDLHLATGVPLLPSVLPALPLLGTDARLDNSELPGYTSSWQCGRQFVIDNAFAPDPQTGELTPSGRYHDYFLLGRLVSITVLLLACGFCYGYARSLYGRTGGLLSLLVVCLSPNVLAHGRLVTPDIYLTAAVLGSLWAFDRLLTAPSWLSSLSLGLGLGAAALCKLTGLLLFLLFPLILFCQALFDRGRPDEAKGDGPSRRRWPYLAVSLLVGIVAVNAGYLFDGTLTSLGQFQFESPQMRRLAACLPGFLPVPLPRYFFQGIDAQLAESGYAAYLMGEFNETGFYSYYLVALLVKTPVPVLLLGGLAWACGRPTRRELPLVVTAAVLFLFFSLSRHKNIGVRYVLFLEPMMAVWIGRLLANRPAQRLRWAIAFAGLCLAGITLTAWPHYLPYFNWASGGPDNGHRWLLDSNLDWGQDLIALRRYMEREQIEEIDLAHFGRVPPAAYGIRHRTLRAGEAPVSRHVAISANLLWGLTYIVNGDLNYWPEDRDAYAEFRSRRPKAILGHSIYVFEMEGRP